MCLNRDSFSVLVKICFTGKDKVYSEMSDQKNESKRQKKANQSSYLSCKKLIMALFLLFCTELYAGEDTDKVDIMEMKIILTTKNDKTILFTLSDNPTSRDFLVLLPMVLSFQDYNRTEKVSYLPSALSTAGSPLGYKPVIGYLWLYAPWGNLCIFYNDFSYSDGLIKLGQRVAG